MTQVFTAYIEYDSDTRLYVGSVPSLPGAHSQGASLDELQQNLKEVIELIHEEQQKHGETVEIVPFVGIQQISVNT
jgi:predicted RNase H-like HicB family nuclease